MPRVDVGVLDGEPVLAVADAEGSVQVLSVAKQEPLWQLPAGDRGMEVRAVTVGAGVCVVVTRQEDKHRVSVTESAHACSCPSPSAEKKHITKYNYPSVDRYCHSN